MRGRFSIQQGSRHVHLTMMHLSAVCPLSPKPLHPPPHPTPLLWHAILAAVHGRHMDIRTPSQPPIVPCHFSSSTWSAYKDVNCPLLSQVSCQLLPHSVFVRAAAACSQKQRVGHVIDHDLHYLLQLSNAHTIVYQTLNPYCTVQYHTVQIPYHTVPYRTVPYRTVPYHTIPYHTIPYRTIPYHTVPYHTIPYHTIPCIPDV